MPTPHNFFNLYRQRATSLLSELYPKSRLIIQSSDQSHVQVLDDGEITLSTTTLLILVNVFFRMLTCPRILPDLGNIDQLENGFTAYPGSFPNTLEELLGSSDGSTVQPDDHVRAHLAKILADQAFDYLICFLAAISAAKSPSVNPIEKPDTGGDYSQVLLADQTALTTMFKTRAALEPGGKNGAETMSKGVITYDSQQQIRLLCFSITTLFAVIQYMPNLPVAVRIVNLQQWCHSTQSEDYTQIIQQACNEAIIAIAAVTRQPPNLDGFNSVLNPASQKILASASPPHN